MDDYRFSVQPDNCRILNRREQGNNKCMNVSYLTERGDYLGRYFYQLTSDLYIIINGVLIALWYSDEIFRPIVVLNAASVRDVFILMDDNARLHCVHLLDNFILDECILRMVWTVNPDINHIEFVWYILPEKGC